jgi:hypothetical protein
VAGTASAAALIADAEQEHDPAEDGQLALLREPYPEELDGLRFDVWMEAGCPVSRHGAVGSREVASGRSL